MQNIQKPCVGIIIPIYNVETYLRKCLDSVINQTYKNLQIILVDDGSTDKSFSIAREYFDKDERIVLISQPNQGASLARNIGIDYALGWQKETKNDDGGGGCKIYKHCEHQKIDYIHFVDSDDWLELSCIEECVKNILQTNAEVVWHGYTAFKQWKQEKEKKYPLVDVVDGVFSPETIFLHMQDLGFSCVVYFLFDIRILEREKIKFISKIIGEDAIFGTQVFVTAKTISILNISLYTYRMRENSLSKYNFQEDKISFSPYQQDIVKKYNTNMEVFLYDFSYSRCVFVVEMIRFLQEKQNELSDRLIFQIERFIRYRAVGAFWICKMKKDPRNARGLCEEIWKYPQYCTSIELTSKIAYRYPSAFFILKTIKDCLYGVYRKIYKRNQK